MDELPGEIARLRAELEAVRAALALKQREAHDSLAQRQAALEKDRNHALQERARLQTEIRGAKEGIELLAREIDKGQAKLAELKGVSQQLELDVHGVKG